MNRSVKRKVSQNLSEKENLLNTNDVVGTNDQQPKQRKRKNSVVNIDQMAEYHSYYNIKSLGSPEETTEFMQHVQRKESVISSVLLPLSVPSGAILNQANILKKGVVRKMTVGTESQFIPQYKLENTKLPRFMLLHFGRVRIVWDWFILIIVAYIAIVVPFNVTFKRDTDIYYSFLLDLSFEIFFIIDIVINFRTTFIQPKSGRLITDSKEIARHYMKGWFFIDCVAAMPFELLYFVNHQWVFLVSVLKTGRLLRLFRVGRRVTRYLEYTATLLILMMVSFGLLAHWFACIWYVIGYEELGSGKTNGWLSELRKQLKYPEPYRNGTADSNPTTGEKYISALYFVFTSLTTVGFGNIAPNTVAEKTFSVLVLLLGAIAQSAIFGNMTAVIQKLYASRAKFHSKATQIKQFVRHHHIEGDLRRRIEDWFISHWSVSKGVNTDEMLESFPQELQADICLHLYKSFLTLPCFMNASRGCLRSISLKVKKAYFSPGELLIKEKDAINSIFYVQRGTLEIVQRDFIVAILGTGDLFGEDISRIKLRQRSNGDVRALMYCDILYLTRENIKEVFRNYPDFTDHFSSNIGLAFNLGGKQKKTSICNSIGLGSIEEENEEVVYVEDSHYSDSNTSSNDEEDNKSLSDSDRSIDRKSSTGRPQRRKLNNRIPLWQQKIRQQERLMNASPSASLKNCLSKIDAQLSNDEDSQSDTLFRNSYTTENEVAYGRDASDVTSNCINDDVERNVQQIELNFIKQYSSESENEDETLLGDDENKKNSIDMSTFDNTNSVSYYDSNRFWNFFENPHPDKRNNVGYETTSSTYNNPTSYTSPRISTRKYQSPRRLSRRSSSLKQPRIVENAYSIDCEEKTSLNQGVSEKISADVNNNNSLVKDNNINNPMESPDNADSPIHRNFPSSHSPENLCYENNRDDNEIYLDADHGKESHYSESGINHIEIYRSYGDNNNRTPEKTFRSSLHYSPPSLSKSRHSDTLLINATGHDENKSLTRCRSDSSEINEESIQKIKSDIAKMREEMNDIKGSINTLTDLVRCAITPK